MALTFDVLSTVGNTKSIICGPGPSGAHNVVGKTRIANILRKEPKGL